MSKPNQTSEFAEQVNDYENQWDYCHNFCGENNIIYYLQEQIKKGEGDIYDDYLEWLNS